jgi:4-amino-4-deoxy-L-arabinose transferase-like glycosyltransferase
MRVCASDAYEGILEFMANHPAFTIFPSGVQRLFSSRLLAIVLLLALVALLLARVGRIPGASAGDEVWYSEAAYWFLKEGVLRRDFHQDGVGSAVRDFLPPLPGLGQAIAFAIGGTNAYTIAIAPTLVTISIVMMFFGLAWRITARPGLAATLAFVFLLPPDAMRYALQPRFDVYVALFVMAGLCVALMATPAHRANLRAAESKVRLFLSGAFLSAAVASYYAFAPVSILLGFAVLFMPVNLGLTARFLWIVIGAAVPALAMLLWIGSDFALFLSQNLVSSEGYGFEQRWRNLIPSTNHIFLQGACLAGLTLVLTVVFLRSKASEGYRLSAACLACAAMVTALLAIFSFRGLLLPLSIMTSVIGLATFAAISAAQPARPRQSAALVSGLLVAGLLSILQIGAYSALGLADRNRIYAPFQAALRQESDLSGVVLVDNPGWLALREELGSGQLLHIPLQGTGPSSFNASDVLYDSDAPGVSSIVMRPTMVRHMRGWYPAVDAFVQRDDVEGPLVVGNKLPNLVHVYRLRATE